MVESISELLKELKELEKEMDEQMDKFQQVIRFIEITIPALGNMIERVDNLEFYYMSKKEVCIYISRYLNAWKAVDGKKKKNQ